ncbi:hypothetical protein A6E15_08910 [Natrinema saccharevitans]|uniref:Uncharacterized protein n=1 Tax=Natrinema saccharevitans TaxID=301967 RepID=A0A1S8AX27_9EURY|nr:DUF5805 domain-containing protein [Natrinema saccharevitans]OLZ41099.1 hypothetical protein A6E15_08910 [Natrinema saccharevitans]
MADDDRTAVKTYVPRYQKEEWADHADELDMSQSEFVRTMVQAGRRDFDVPSSNAIDTGTEAGDQTRTRTDTDDLQERVLAAIDREAVLDWDELVDELIDDIENEVDTALGELQDKNHIRYSGRDGGYVRVKND